MQRFGFLRFLCGVGLAAAGLLLASCVTQDQIKQIVSDANLATLSADLNLGAADPQATGTAPTNWQEASKKIEAFIAANPEQKSTNAALRVRQAVMLLQNRMFNLAKAAFDDAALDNLHTSRDRALKRLQPDLLWWYRAASATESIDFGHGERTQAAIDAVLADLKAPEDEGMRDFLAAMRAFIGVKMAKDAPGELPARRYLENALNGFAAALPVGESAAWEAPPAWPPAGLTPESAITVAHRRHFRAEALVVAAKKVMRANAIANPRIADGYFRRRLAE